MMRMMMIGNQFLLSQPIIKVFSLGKNVAVCLYNFSGLGFSFFPLFLSFSVWLVMDISVCPLYLLYRLDYSMTRHDLWFSIVFDGLCVQEFVHSFVIESAKRRRRKKKNERMKANGPARWANICRTRSIGMWPHVWRLRWTMNSVGHLNEKKRSLISMMSWPPHDPSHFPPSTVFKLIFTIIFQCYSSSIRV